MFKNTVRLTVIGATFTSCLFISAVSAQNIPVDQACADQGFDFVLNVSCKETYDAVAFPLWPDDVRVSIVDDCAAYCGSEENIAKCYLQKLPTTRCESLGSKKFFEEQIERMQFTMKPFGA